MGDIPPDVDPDNDQYGEPNRPDVDPSVRDPPATPKLDTLVENATPSVLQKLQKWGDYEAYGNVVQPSLFIPMKTPLSQAILNEWTLPEAPKHSLTVTSLLQQQHFLHRQVGMIIDLSNHETLYADDLPPFVQYEHVQLVAKVFPDQAQVDEVIDLAEKYWAVNPTQHIAIHCAYGKPAADPCVPIDLQDALSTLVAYLHVCYHMSKAAASSTASMLNSRHHPCSGQRRQFKT